MNDFADLSDEFRGEPLFERLVAYCELSQRGLRQQALAELDQFLALVSALDIGRQRALALKILHALFPFLPERAAPPYPLQKGFLDRLLDEWIDESPDDPIPVGELGLLRWEDELLEKAINLGSIDDRVHGALAAILIEHVDYATHELNEGVFIGAPLDALALLDKAESHLPGAAEFKRQEIHQLRSLVNDWLEYNRQPNGTFPAWCSARGKGPRVGDQRPFRTVG
jgi:hypothetical protein